MISRLLSALSALYPQPSSRELADAIWLAQTWRDLAAEREERHEPVDRGASAVQAPEPGSEAGQEGAGQPQPSRPPDGAILAEQPGVARPHPPPAGMSELTRAQHGALYLPIDDERLRPPSGLSVRAPGVPAIPGTLEISRSLRWLRRKQASWRELILDEEATAAFSAETGIWLPAFGPIQDRWLELCLVVDDSASMVMWQPTVSEFRLLVERLGAFRDVRVWKLNSDRDGPLVLHSAASTMRPGGRDPRELVDPTRRRLILVISDCIGAAWASGAIAQVLRLWGSAGPVAILQPLPQRLWGRCAAEFTPARFCTTRAGAPNAGLRVMVRDGHADAGDDEVPVPVMELEPRWLAPWASLVAASTSDWVDGMALLTGEAADGGPAGESSTANVPTVDDAFARVQRFRATASPTAWQLASYFAATSLSLPVMRLVQKVMLPGSRPSHLAEVFLSGLLYRATPYPGLHPDDIQYEFHDGVRELLLSNLRRAEALRILREVGAFISARAGAAVVDFPALLAGEGAVPGAQPFASVAATVLRRMGGRYAQWAELAGRAVQMTDPTERGAQADAHDRTASGDTVTISRSSSQSTTQQDRRSGARPSVWRGVPARNPNFTGREELLKELRGRLMGGISTALLPQAVHGLGGVGKTQLAVEYVYRYADEYDLLCWIEAEQPMVIRRTLAELAPSLGVPESSDVDQTMQDVLHALRLGQPYVRWLLVFDNADEPEGIIELLSAAPYASGHILVTSRNHRWSNVAPAIEVDVFSRDESIAYLRRRLPEISAEDAARLAERLGDLPLAIEQAAAWHLATGKSVDEYLRILDERLLQLLSEARVTSYPRPVAAAWDVSLSSLRELAPAAVDLLQLCAFFGSDTIPSSILWAGRHARLPAALARMLKDQIEYRRVVRAISRYSLARVDPATGNIEIHRLVQAIVRERLSPEDRAEVRRSVHELLASANPGQPDDPATWQRHAELFPHIIPSGVTDGETEEIRVLVLDQIRYLYRRGDYWSSRELGELAYNRWKETLGPEDAQTLIACRHLATTLRSLGETERARRLIEETLARMQARFGDDHEHTLATANTSGGDLRIRGEFVKALQRDEDTLARHRRVFGDTDPQTLNVANNLAIDLRLLGHFARARDLDQDTLRRRVQVLRREDPLLLASTNGLARDLFGLGDYKGAKEILELPLEEFRARLGADHPEVVQAARTLAVTYRKLGEYDRAYDLAARNFEFYYRRFGMRHLDTLAAMTSLSNDLRMVDKLEEAGSRGDAALRQYQQILGANHPFTHVCAGNLAIVYRAMDRHAEARDLDEAALSALQRLLGEEHNYTLCAAANNSNDLALAGDHAKALELSRVAFERSKRVRGENHPYTLACAVNLALDLRAVGELARARELRASALARLGRVLGEGHPDTVAATADQRAESDIEPPST